MKEVIYLSMILIFLMKSCSGDEYQKKEVWQSVEIAELIDFSISLKDTLFVQGKELRVLLEVKNISNQALSIDTPLCWKRMVSATLTSSEGEKMTEQFIHKSACRPSLKKIEKQEEHSEIFEYNLNKLYDLRKVGIYKLYFTYYGRVLNEEKRFGSKPNEELNSNVLTISVVQ